ncbi:hypothetical protein [Pseudomonas syringae group genomosp. 3]|uniref:hypothetical protein n=1 Tax=Pseudomonas syringae group genomosp. 3 TaxID=251701 RepID=UPI000F004BF2|nr:hypothetical protein [Pseudomonas syringae group genomosp. 3]
MSLNLQAATAGPNVALVLQALLRAIIRQPAIFSGNVEVLNALKSQGGIAKLELSFNDNGLNTTKNRTSTNTLKTHSDRFLDGGFKGIDELRKHALIAIDTYNNRLKLPNKRTQAGLSRYVQELESQLDNHQRANFLLLQGLGLAVSQLRNIRSNIDPELLEHRAKELIKTLTSLVTINPPPFDTIPEPRETSNTINMSDYRK